MSESDMVIRPELDFDQIHERGEGYSTERAKATKKALRHLHTLETMAVNIYKFQITKSRSPLNTLLVAAMANEMTHLQDFQIALYEYNLHPSKLRAAYWLVGFSFGLGSRILGRRSILRTGIWVEKKAVRDYAHILAEVEWDEETRKVVAKNAADEDAHVARWTRTLAETR
jgi:demethoxyubiquinone hydroxylase (CLK1/Coq7/Cat5 family)